MKVCFVGAGSIGKRHIRNLYQLSKDDNFPVEIHLLRSSDRKLDDDINGIISKVFHESGETDEFYDAIFITNPTYLHYKTILDMKDRSRFFFVEKPVFDDVNVDTSVLDEENNTYYVACPLRYTRVLLRAKEILDKEKVLSVRATSSSYLPDWRPGTDYRTTYSAHKDQGGGVKIDLIHEWDYLIHLFGFPESVKQFYGKYSELEIDSEDIAIYIAEYKDKLIELHLDYFGKLTQRYLEVITTDNVYVFDIANSNIKKNGSIVEEYNEKPNDKYMEEMRYFYKLTNNALPNVNSIRNAVNTMNIACEK